MPPLYLKIYIIRSLILPSWLCNCGSTVYITFYLQVIISKALHRDLKDHQDFNTLFLKNTVNCYANTKENIAAFQRQILRKLINALVLKEMMFSKMWLTACAFVRVDSNPVHNTMFHDALAALSVEGHVKP